MGGERIKRSTEMSAISHFAIAWDLQWQVRKSAEYRPISIVLTINSRAGCERA
jgi:hypothetical protein